jgi:hypothetical protein
MNALIELGVPWGEVFIDYIRTVYPSNIFVLHGFLGVE